MPRIPYLPKDLAEPADVVTAVRKRRGGVLSELDRMLLHSPAFALGWNSHLGAVRTGLTLNGRLRELAKTIHNVCAVAARVANSASTAGANRRRAANITDSSRIRNVGFRVYEV